MADSRLLPIHGRKGGDGAYSVYTGNTGFRTRIYLCVTKPGPL